MARDNRAIDYRRFGAQVQQPLPGPVALPENQKVERPKQEGRPYFKYVLGALLVFALVMTMIANSAKLTKLTKQSADIESKITALETEARVLETKRDKMYSLTFVEEYATSRLGMVKSDNTNIVCVNLSKPENITVSGGTRSTPSLLSAIVSGFEKIVEFFN